MLLIYLWLRVELYIQMSRPMLRISRSRLQENMIFVLHICPIRLSSKIVMVFSFEIEERKFLEHGTSKASTGSARELPGGS